MVVLQAIEDSCGGSRGTILQCISVLDPVEEVKVHTKEPHVVLLCLADFIVGGRSICPAASAGVADTCLQKLQAAFSRVGSDALATRRDATH